jgi:mercuric ion binding protein
MKPIFLLFALTLTLFAQTKVVIVVEKMHCPLCTASVKSAIKSVEGVQSVSVKLNTKTAEVVFSDKTDIKEILKAIKKTSYKGEVLSTTVMKSD